MAIAFLHDQPVIARSILVEAHAVEIAVLGCIGASAGQALKHGEHLQAYAQCLLLIGILEGGKADGSLTAGHGEG
ncbi:MAG: hypothetical protein MO846_02400 [Candidatus Devosia symbiotica]|nr:hypothetical protein [Candidatus Devosia symbiotica]